jgi:hypothetical protein
MEDRANTIESNSHARSPAFRYFRTVVSQHRFNLRPKYVRALFEDRFQHALMFAHSIYDIRKRYLLG